MTRQRAIVYLLVAAVLWSLGGLLIKLVSWNPIAIAGTRSAIACGFLLCFFRPRFRPSSLEILGGVAYAATVILFVVANKLTTASNAILLQYGAPAYVALLSRWFLGEAPSPLDWTSVGMVLGGMVLFFFDRLSPGNMLGNLIAIGSGIAFAFLIVILRMQKDAEPLQSVFVGNLFAAFIGLPFLFGRLPDYQGWIGLMLLGTLQIGLSYLLYAQAIRKVRALEASLIPMIEPILNPLWVFLALHESPGRFAFLGGGIILLAVFLRYLRGSQ
ncbi:MAG: DMT family transporter [Candidatus Caldatribacterium sp.]|uniref:DMT family transporter n=1 Tax=Candidatus Caldatribacterium sp. TaxID=2282143 RepID=UPI002996F45F|nr:DMT family transporter [Candidatus Caldatribacterium sp.]MCX7730656.1 DMT family transporter [Candidatus Caldatribacterium sp.]MDW8081199.1 DMT family transporter [Candidatus Calescibacterium sp.]